MMNFEMTALWPIVRYPLLPDKYEEALVIGEVGGMVTRLDCECCRVIDIPGELDKRELRCCRCHRVRHYLLAFPESGSYGQK